MVDLAPWITLICFGYAVSTTLATLLHIRGILLLKFAVDEVSERAL